MPWTIAGCCAQRPAGPPRPSRCGRARRATAAPGVGRLVRRCAPPGGTAAPGPAGSRARPDPGSRGTRRGDEPATAAEYALILTDPGPPQLARLGPERLSARERELVTLVARGRTDAQIAAELYMSIRTVRSHLDRIRDKTGCRRRADLTRLAPAAGLV